MTLYQRKLVFEMGFEGHRLHPAWCYQAKLKWSATNFGKSSETITPTFSAGSPMYFSASKPSRSSLRLHWSWILTYFNAIELRVPFFMRASLHTACFSALHTRKNSFQKSNRFMFKRKNVHLQHVSTTYQAFLLVSRVALRRKTDTKLYNLTWLSCVRHQQTKRV